MILILLFFLLLLVGGKGEGNLVNMHAEALKGELGRVHGLVLFALSTHDHVGELARPVRQRALETMMIR